MIHVPMITPFGPDGRVDAAALERLAHEVLDGGARGLVALGTTGEPASLDDAERTEVATVVGRACAERGARFTVGAGAGGTDRAARELAALAALPVRPDAALVTAPAFTRPGEAGALAHFRALAAASPVPLVAYHIPHRTGQELGVDALRDLAAIPGVTAMKYATGALDAAAVTLLADPPPDFDLLSGDDVVAPAFLALGAPGAILATAHLATAQWCALAAAEAGTGEGTAAPGAPAEGGGTGAAGARALGLRLAALATALFREPNPAVIKAVLHARGRIPTPDVRLPLLPASPQARDAALAALARVEAYAR